MSRESTETSEVFNRPIEIFLEKVEQRVKRRQSLPYRIFTPDGAIPVTGRGSKLGIGVAPLLDSPPQTTATLKESHVE